MPRIHNRRLLYRCYGFPWEENKILAKKFQKAYFGAPLLLILKKCQCVSNLQLKQNLKLNLKLSFWRCLRSRNVIHQVSNLGSNLKMIFPIRESSFLSSIQSVRCYSVHFLFDLYSLFSRSLIQLYDDRYYRFLIASSKLGQSISFILFNLLFMFSLI